MIAVGHIECTLWDCPEVHKAPPPPKRLRGYAALAATMRGTAA